MMIIYINYWGTFDDYHLQPSVLVMFMLISL